MTLTRLGVLLILATLCFVIPAALPTTQAARAATVCLAPVTIANGDFEYPVIPANTMVLEPEADMGGWKTNAPDKLFEHWREVRQGFTAGQGNQFIELNANYVSAVYQDLTTVPGQRLRWELKHRGRLGTDTMAVKIGPPGAVVLQGNTLSDGSAAWGTHSLNYTVPAHQTTTRFWFESITAAQNKPTYGNFLDAISFGSEPCLSTTASVSSASGGGAANVGDVLTYTVTAENKGGNPAKNVVLSDDLPAGVEFVQGSIRTITGSSSTAVTDNADTDTGEYDVGARTVRVRAGAGATQSAGGVLPVGQTRAFSYQVRVTAAAASSSLSNEATATFFNDLANATQTSTSTSAGTTVAAAANLAVTADLLAPGVVAGQTATTELTVTNSGPNTANAVQLNAVVPAGIAGVTASPSGPCTLTPATAAGPTAVACTLGSLAAGASTRVTVAGTVLAQATPGAQATLTASVSTTTFETSQTDNATSVSAAVATSTDLEVSQAYTPADPVPGDTITYTVSVFNRGPSQARGVVLTDPIASTSNFVSATSGTGACNITTGTRTVECTLQDIMPNTTSTVIIVVSLPANGNGTVNNAVSVSSSTPESDVRDNNNSVSKTGTAEADIGVELTLEKNRAKPGDVVGFTLTVTNYGPWPATNVSFNTIVPPGFVVNRPANPFCTPIACTLPGMLKGQVIKIEGTTTVGMSVAAGPQSASTTVISPTTDPRASNDTSTVNFTIELEADLRVTQSLTNPAAGETGLVAGHTVRGVVSVYNDGSTRAEGLVLRQAIPAGRPIPTATTDAGATCNFQGTGTPGTLTPDGGIYVCTRTVLERSTTPWEVVFDGVLLSPGYSNTVYTRTATISATTPDPDSADNSVTTTRSVERRSDLDLDKSTSTPSVVQSNDVRFAVSVRNDGPSDATTVLIREDPQTGLVITSGTTATGSFDTHSLTWTIPNIPVNTTVTLTLDGSAQGSGPLTDVSRIVASDSTDPQSSDNTDDATVTAAAAAPSLGLEVLTNSPAVPAAGGFAEGEAITYSYRVTNTGNLAVSALTVTGGLTGTDGTGTCNGGTLARNATVTCPAGSYTVRASDVAGKIPVANVVKAVAETAANPVAVEFARVTSSSSVVSGQASLVVVVTPTVSEPTRQHAAKVNDEIRYDYVITNNGPSSQDNVTLTDSKARGPLVCPPATLAPGASMSCHTPDSSRYKVVQADLDAGGSVSNNAIVTGQPGGGAVETYGPFRAAVTVAAPAPAVEITVSSPTTAPVDVNDRIDYEYEIKNVGNVAVKSLAVNDSRVTGITCPAEIPVDATESCESPAGQGYRVTQADIDDGVPVHNDAIVSAVGKPNGSPVTSAEGGASVAVAVADPRLTLTHTVAAPPGGAKLGDTLDFVYRVENDGNVTMSDVTVSDTLNGAADCGLTPPSIPVGGHITCDAPRYTVTQADVDATGPITGTAQVRGRSPGQPTTSGYGSDPLSVTMANGATQLTVVLNSTVTPAEHRTAVEPGDRIAFDYRITNSGDVTMEQIQVAHTLTSPVNCPLTRLAPGAVMVCGPRSEYTVTLDDIRKGGTIDTVVTIQARGPGRPVKTFGPATAAVAVLVPQPSLRAVLSTEVSSGRPDSAETGDRVTYHYEVVNVGNQPIDEITARAGLVGEITCPEAELATRESMTCTPKPYTVTEEDVEAAKPIADEISLNGKAPLDAKPRTFGPFPIRVGVAPVSTGLSLEMNAEVTASVQNTAVSTGNGVIYHYTVTNTGNVSVDKVAVADERAGPVTCAATRLAAFGVTRCRSDRTYKVTQEDVDSGKALVTDAVASGLQGTAKTPVTSNQAEVTVPIVPAAPRLAADQKAAWSDTDGDGELSTRDDVVSTLHVTNSGNVTLVDIRVTGLPAPVTCDPDHAAPGQTVICVSGVYHLTDEDIARGNQTYEAKVSGLRTIANAPPAEATAPSTVVIPGVTPSPSPSVTRNPTPRPSRSATAAPSRSVSTSPSPSSDSDAGNVPVTGAPSFPIALAGVALILGGFGLLLLTYRLRNRHQPTRMH